MCKTDRLNDSDRYGVWRERSEGDSSPEHPYLQSSATFGNWISAVDYRILCFIALPTSISLS